MASLSQQSAENGILFVLYVCISTLGVCELALLVKLQESTKLRPPRTIQVYVPPFWLCFFGFHPGRLGWNLPYEQTTIFVPVTEPARLPGSYGEALRVFIWERFPARPTAEISVVTGPARLLIRTNRNFYEENGEESGEARSRKPGSYDHYIVKTHWKTVLLKNRIITWILA